MLRFIVLVVGVAWPTFVFADTNEQVLKDFMTKAPNASSYDPLPAPGGNNSSSSSTGVIVSPGEASGGSGSALDNLKEQQLRKSFEERQIR